MKYIYACEKCGKTFEDSGEAYICEESHTVAQKFGGDYSNNYMQKWETGKRLPKEIIVGNDYYDGDKHLCDYGIYKFIGFAETVREEEQEKINEQDERDNKRRQLEEQAIDEIKDKLVENGYEEDFPSYGSYWKYQDIYEETFGSRYDCERERM